MQRRFLLCVQIKNDLSPSPPRKNNHSPSVKGRKQDRNCQSILCPDKNCQEAKFIHMQLLKPEMKKNQVICSYPNQQRNKLIKRSLVKMTRNVNPPSFTRIQCVLTRTVKIPSLCRQCSQQRKCHVKCGQCQDQQCHNPVTRKGYLYMITRSVNLPCVLTRTVKKFNVLICGHWNQQWICSQLNQPSYKKMCSDKNCQSTKCMQPKEPTSHKCDDKNCQSAKHMCCDKKKCKNLKELIFFSYVVSAKDCLQTDWDTVWNI